MAAWRRKVRALFPELRPDMQRRDFSAYQVFFDLLPRVREAHAAGDVDTLRRVYGFAEWCFAQTAKELWNSAGVAFYEHLFDGDRSTWPDVVPWLSPEVIEGCMGLWAWRLSGEDLSELRRLFAEGREPLYPDARAVARPV